MDLERQFYDVACSFPTMRRKGVENGNVPGISKDNFSPDELAEFLYHGRGGVWSTAEKHVLEFLLNLIEPNSYDRFNLGHAMNAWDQAHINACLAALKSLYIDE